MFTDLKKNINYRLWTHLLVGLGQVRIKALLYSMAFHLLLPNIISYTTSSFLRYKLRSFLKVWEKEFLTFLQSNLLSK